VSGRVAVAQRCERIRPPRRDMPTLPLARSAARRSDPAIGLLPGDAVTHRRVSSSVIIPPHLLGSVTSCRVSGLKPCRRRPHLGAGTRRSTHASLGWFGRTESVFVGDRIGATVRLVGPVHLVRLDGGVIDLSAYLAMHDIPAVDIQRDPDGRDTAVCKDTSDVFRRVLPSTVGA
jgi:hypothetical protein